MKNSGIPYSSLPPRLQAQVREQLTGRPLQEAREKDIAVITAALNAPAPKPRLRQSSKGPNKTEAAFAAYGIREPVTEYVFAKPRRWRFDYAWPEKRLALEVEGGVWTGGRHTRGKGFLGDMEKYNTAVLLGWRVLRCTPGTLKTDATFQMLREALGHA